MPILAPNRVKKPEIEVGKVRLSIGGGHSNDYHPVLESRGIYPSDLHTL